MKAAGFSVQRLAAPVLIIAAAISLGALAFQETALPVLNARADEVDRVKIRREAPRRLAARQDVWYRRSDREFLRVGRFDPVRQQLSQVILVEFDPAFRLVRRVDLDRAVWSSGGWELGTGMVRRFGNDAILDARMQERPAISLPASLEAFGVRDTSPASMTARQLYATVTDVTARGHEAGTWVLHLHAKLAFPTMIVALAMVAIASAVRWGQSGRLIGAVAAVTISIAWWSVNSVALSLGLADLLPPVLAAWTSTVVFGGLGAALFLGSPS